MTRPSAGFSHHFDPIDSTEFRGELLKLGHKCRTIDIEEFSSLILAHPIACMFDHLNDPDEINFDCAEMVCMNNATSLIVELTDMRVQIELPYDVLNQDRIFLSREKLLPSHVTFQCTSSRSKMTFTIMQRDLTEWQEKIIF
jgi:hypothetical protein